MKKKTNQHSRLTNTYTVEKTIYGYLLDCSARRLSVHTISDYKNTMKNLVHLLEVTNSYQT
jgi:hypothetical protein